MVVEPFSMPSVVNRRIKNTELTSVPMVSQIRNLPKRVRVLSQIMPIIGSLIASQILATANSTPTNAGFRPSVSVKYSIRNAPTRLQIASLPIAPIPNAYFWRAGSLAVLFSFAMIRYLHVSELFGADRRNFVHVNPFFCYIV